MLQVKLLSENAKCPARGSDEAAGYDLFSAEDHILLPGQRLLVKTNVAICMPGGYYGRIASRSSVAYRYRVDVCAGVVDADYRGDVGVVLHNYGENVFEIKKGDRIAQLILTAIITPKVVVVDELDVTRRGEQGYGSTGK